jgi:hypothetical protein
MRQREECGTFGVSALLLAAAASSSLSSHDLSDSSSDF